MNKILAEFENGIVDVCEDYTTGISLEVFYYLHERANVDFIIC